MAQKSKKKSELIAFNSPWVTARFPKLNKPDTDGPYADGKFKTDCILEYEDIAAVRAEMEAAAKKLLPNVALEDVNLPLKEFKRKKDKDSKEKVSDGWGFRAKTQRRPAIFDAKRKRLPQGVVVGAGSILRIAGALKAYEKTSEMIVKQADGSKVKESITEYGLTLYLNKVQVKKLEQGTDWDSADGFDDVEDGFEYDGGDEGSDEFAGNADDATDL
jgi:hypothetical protein